MNKDYALIRNGIVENITVADADFVAAIHADWDRIEPLQDGAGIGWRWLGKKFVPPPAPEAPAETEQRRISVLAFRRRFTASERATLEWAAVDRADQSDAHRQQAAALRATLADQAAATFIDLDDESTVDGVQMLEALGLLAPGRANEIITAPVQPAELP